MKKISLLFLILSLLFITACTKDSSENIGRDNESLLASKITLSTEEWMSIAYDDPKEVSENDIRNIIDNFISQEYVISKNQTRADGNISSFKQIEQYCLAEKMPIATRSGEVSAYNIDCAISEFEFELGGEKYSAVVSMDERFPKVLAFVKIEENEFESNRKTEPEPENNGSQSPLNLSYETLYNYLYAIEANKESLRDKTLLKISQELNEPIENISYDKIKDYICISDAGNSLTRAEYITLPSDQILSGCWPLVEVSWGSDNITSNYMPYYGDNRRINVWDGITSTMHLLSVIQPNITMPAQTYEGHGCKSSMIVDWNLLTETGAFTPTDFKRKEEMHGRLTRLINDDAGFRYVTTSPNKFNFINYSSSYKINNFYDVLQKYMFCDPVVSYNLNTILNSLVRARPVFANSNDPLMPLPLPWSIPEPEPIYEDNNNNRPRFDPRNDMFVFDGYLKTRSDTGINSTYLHIKFTDSRNDGLAYFDRPNNTGYYLVNANSSLDIHYANPLGLVSYSEDIKIIPECRPDPTRVVVIF